MSRISVYGLQVASELYDFLERSVLPDLGMSSATYWQGFSQIVHELAPVNAKLLLERDRLQAEIDDWHTQHPGPIAKMGKYLQFLEKIGYLVKDPGKFKIKTRHVDDELALQAGPQLVVPITNARYALNAANARWGSLYDALYGTDVISEEEAPKQGPSGQSYNPVRGQKVIEYARYVLDRTAPLAKGSHIDSCAYYVENGALKIAFSDGTVTSLKKSKQFIGYQGSAAHPSAVLLQHHGLHLEITINPEHHIGRLDAAGVSDLIIEAALSTILDLEDSVAVVDAADKVQAYSNWLGILRGTLTEEVTKGGAQFTRRLQADRVYIDPTGQGEIRLHGRSLLFIRNVGHLMTNPAILWGPNEQEIPEGIMDALITTTIALYDVKGLGQSGIRNSRQKSVYIVKPKMHGPAEVAFAVDLFARVERWLGLPSATVKLGIMDEERRTSVNLRACIAAAADRVAFINTGFLDRTGDEMHTSMKAGPMRRKADMKTSAWIQAYERNNVLVGLTCGFRGHAQIGKGMWAMPDLMGRMLKEKIAHPQAGANTAWVPSPTGATLHALHYHQVDVQQVQKNLEKVDYEKERDQLLVGLLTIPVVHQPDWSADEIRRELDNNVQGILGYVVRWIDQGVGCSKVPDIDNISLMEDRATLRISSQHIANWLCHGVVSSQQVRAAFRRMAKVVDAQNAHDPQYKPLADHFKDPAFCAASALVFKGEVQPNGYTEPLLHAWRRKVKDVVLCA
jgi:malate synthase